MCNESATPMTADIVVLSDYRMRTRHATAPRPADGGAQRGQDGLDALTLRSNAAREDYGNRGSWSEDEAFRENPLIIRDNRARAALGYELTSER